MSDRLQEPQTPRPKPPIAARPLSAPAPPAELRARRFRGGSGQRRRAGAPGGGRRAGQGSARRPRAAAPPSRGCSASFPGRSASRRRGPRPGLLAMNIDVEFHIRHNYPWARLPASVRQVRAAGLPARGGGGGTRDTRPGVPAGL